MDFSLSSSLVGSAVSNPDKLALDLQFAADKTLTARRGPTPTFTRASSGTFVGSDGLIQSAGNNVARFDHDLSTLECKGLLIEESRTNLIIQSENFGAASWSKGGSNITVNTQTAPDGNVTADTLNVTTPFANVLGTSAIGVVAGQSYTASFWCKRGTATDLKYSVRNENNFSMIVPETSYYSQTSTEWRRISLSFVIPTGCSSIVVRINNNSSSLGTVHFWGAQLEAGLFLTSYIPTTTASVIRSADVCSITGSAFSGFYNTTEGSFATSQIFNAPLVSGAGQIVFDVNDTTNSNRTRAFRFNTTGFVGFSSTAGNIQDVTITGSTAIAAGVVTKFAGCMKANDFAIYFNNVLQGVDTTAVMLSAPTAFTLGEVSSGTPGKLPLNGTILSIRYYKKRLPNAKLQALTV